MGLKETLEQGKKIAKAAFDTAAEASDQVTAEIGKRFDEFDAKYGEQIRAKVDDLNAKTDAFADKLGAKIDGLVSRKPPEGPKQ